MINKFQQGGKKPQKTSNQQTASKQQQEAIKQFVIGLAQALEAQPEQVMQIAQQVPEAFQAAVMEYQNSNDMAKAAQAFVTKANEKTAKAAHGMKLNYIKRLGHKCAEDEEVVYFRKGGMVDCGCKKKEDGGKVSAKEPSAIDDFKKARGAKVCPKCGKVHKAGMGCNGIKITH